MEKLNKQMDDALNTKVTALNATDDETGDGKVDALVFTAGIGENDDLTRAAACRGLEHMGFKLDAAANAARSQSTRLISAPDSPTAIYVVPTDEELEIAQLTQALVFSS